MKEMKEDHSGKESVYKLRWLILTTIGMGIFLSTIDVSIVNVALPTLVRELNTRFSVVQWVALAYMLILSTLILPMGRLGDIVGKKSVYACGMIIFVLSSAFCGLSTNVYWLIGSRVVQAIGSAMMAALGTALVTEAFPSRERGKAFGVVGTFVSVGIITGPTLGGIIIDALSWHWIFFVNIPIGIAGVIMVFRFVPYSSSNREQRFDYWGASTLFIGVLSFLLSLTLLQSHSFTHPLIIGLWASCLIFLSIFVLIESKSLQPMIPLSLFQNRLLSVNLLTAYISFMCTAGVVLLMPFFLENVLKYNPHQVGLMLSVVPASAGLISPISGMMSDRFGTWPIIVLGLLFLVFGYVGLTALNEHTTAFEYILKFLPIGLGIGIFQSPNNSAIMGAAPSQRLGIVSGLLSVTRTLGQATGIAIVGTFWASRVVFHSHRLASEKRNFIPEFPQVKALQETLLAIVFLIITALLLGVWGLYVERIYRRKKGIV